MSNNYRYNASATYASRLATDRGAQRFFFFSSRRRHTRYWRDWSSDVCSSDLPARGAVVELRVTTHLARMRGGDVARHRAGFQDLAMTAQGRGRRDAEDEVDPVGATPVDDLRTAIGAVGAQQDLRRRPVCADGSEQPSQEGADVRAFGSLGGPQNGRDDAALSVEDNDGLEPVFVIVGIEQPQLLATVHGVEGVVDVEHDPLGHLP